ncbi:MAG: ATP-dependent helicase, partial [Candidatus Roizmanbacteria bacterium]
MPTHSFDQVYKSLNSAQKAAVDTIEGPVMVLAGPGTGKTHVLSARIANILQKTDTSPSSILALTFTESAAANMRSRIVSMIGKEGYQVGISTFHGFCQDVIRTYGEYFPLAKSAQSLSELDRYTILEKLLSDPSYDILKPLNSPYHYISDISGSISQLKREGYSPDEFEKIVSEESKHVPESKNKRTLGQFEKKIKKNEELVRLYKQYESSLRKQNLYDFEDMINLVVHAFKNHEDLLRDYQEKLLYILVDEYQDTNSAQNQVVDLLASYWGSKANLFVVGDPHQSIYRFQGASLENVLGFVRTYPESTIITLEEGYRCPQLIYDAAYHVIQNNDMNMSVSADMSGYSRLYEGISQKLKGSEKKESAIYVDKLPSQVVEVLYIAESIKKYIDSGIPPESIAVLYRNNSDSILIREALEKWGIPYEIEGGSNILHDEMIGQLIHLLHIIVQLREGSPAELLFEVCSYPWADPDGLIMTKIARMAGKKRIMLDDLVEKSFSDKDLADFQLSQLEYSSFVSYIQKILEWGRKEYSMIFTEWFEQVIKDSGYLDSILSAENKIENIKNLNALFNKIKEFVYRNHEFDLNGFLSCLEKMKEHNLSIESSDLAITSSAVHLSTVHKAKGREWDIVFLLHCIDGKWGNKRIVDKLPLPSGLLKNTDVSKKEENEDERRLFYVALTRSAQIVHITFPHTIVSDGYSREVIPSMFIDEMDSETKSSDEMEVFLKNADDLLLSYLTPTKRIDRSSDERSYYAHIVKDFSLSVTALNSYLRDPRD